MIPKRNLLFLTLPGMALLLGLFWIRRKKKDDTNHDESDDLNIEQKKNNQVNNTRFTKSISISEPSLKMQQKRDKGIETMGKSAPIDINPKRTPPIHMTDEQIDKDILKLTTTTVTGNVCGRRQSSIEENECESLFSPNDLPGSSERIKFTSFNKKIRRERVETVIVKATIPPKISPEHSFGSTISTTKSSIENSDQIEGNFESGEEESVEKLVATTTTTTASVTTATNIPTQQQPQQPIKSSTEDQMSTCSLDSGKGSSPPRSVGPPVILYEFLVAQHLIGQLVGRKAKFSNLIKEETATTLTIRKHPKTNKVKICILQGTRPDIDAALKLIRQRLPIKRYPSLTLDRVFILSSDIVENAAVAATAISMDNINPAVIQLQLIEGINNDVSVTGISKDGNIFLHQPLHPSYPALNVLQTCMNKTYTQCNAPVVETIGKDIVCACCIEEQWYRVQIIEQINQDECLVKLLDFAGVQNVHLSNLRQIRKDFMTVPFQSISCFLSNIKPTDGEWSMEAINVLQMLTQGGILQAQVTGYREDGTPEIFLYASYSPNSVVFLNNELVARNLAEWVDDSELTA